MSDSESTDWSSSSKRSSSNSERSSSESDDSDSDPSSDPCSDPDYDPKAGPRSINKVWGGSYSSYRRHDYDKTESEDKGYHDSPGASRSERGDSDQSYDSSCDTNAESDSVYHDSPGATASRKQRSEQGDSDQSNDSASDTNTELEDDSMEETSDDSSNISTDVNSREESEKEKEPRYKTQTLRDFWKSQKPQPHRRQQTEVTPSKALKKFRKKPGVSKVFSDDHEEFTLKENDSTAANVNGHRKQSYSGDSQAIKRLRKRELQVVRNEQQGHVLLDKSQSPSGISGSSSAKANAQPAAAVSSAQNSRKRRKKRTGEREVVETPQEDEVGLTPSKRSRQYKNKDDKPNLPDLKKFTGKSGQFNILERIGTQYNDFGTFLLQDNEGSKVEAAIQKWQRDPRLICEEIVKQWLLGKGKRPVSYATLVECLKDAKLNELAEDIESVLQ